MEHDLLSQKRTAYALGELDAAERAVIEADLIKSEAHRLEIEEIRALSAAVTDALAHEKRQGMSEIQHLAIESTLQRMTEDHEQSARMRLRRQRLAFWVPTGIAACALLASGITLMMLSAQHQADPILPPSSGTEVSANNIRLGAGSNSRARANDVIKQYNDLVAIMPPVGAPVVFGPHVDSVTSADADVIHAFHPAALTPLSTFPLVVDTATVPFINKFIQRGILPPRETVHVEAMINAFSYDDVKALPDDKDGKPVALKTEVSDCPWNAGHKLARVVVKTKGSASEAEAQAIVAEQVRVRVEFNPSRVSSYRLIGFENRQPSQTNDPREERTDLKAGHTLTVLYEIVPVGNFGRPTGPASDLLKYQRPPQLTFAADSDELFTVMLRYRTEADLHEQVVEAPAIDPGLRLADASNDFRFAAAVAQFGLVLLDSPTKGAANLDTVRALAEQSLGTDPTGDRARFLGLIERARDVAVN